MFQIPSDFPYSSDSSCRVYPRSDDQTSFAYATITFYILNIRHLSVFWSSCLHSSFSIPLRLRTSTRSWWAAVLSATPRDHGLIVLLSAGVILPLIPRPSTEGKCCLQSKNCCPHRMHTAHVAIVDSTRLQGGPQRRLQPSRAAPRSALLICLCWQCTRFRQVCVGRRWGKRGGGG